MLSFSKKSIFKRTLYRIGICLLIFTMLLSAFSIAISAASATSTNGTLLILGDSIATGHSLPDYNSSSNPKSQYSWATLLSNTYNAKQVNLAVDGNTTADLLGVVRNSSNYNSISQADVICVSIGGNNFLQLMGALYAQNALYDPEQVEAAYTAMQIAAESDLDGIFTGLKYYNPDADILMQTMFEPYRYFTVEISAGVTVAEWMGAYINRYNTMLKTKAESYGFTVVDVAAKFRTDGQRSWLYDSMSEGTPAEAIIAIGQANPHPTKEGHQGIFEAYQSTAGTILSSAFSSNDSSLENDDNNQNTNNQTGNNQSNNDSKNNTGNEKATSAETSGGTNDASTDSGANNAKNDSKNANNESGALWLAVGICSGVVLILGIGAFIIVKKKRV